VELTDAKTLEGMFAVLGAPPRSISDRAGRAVYQAPPSKAKNNRRCQCRVCPACLENARWERIFQEKFADPDYYATGLLMRWESSLHSS
jgi:hypothetical protein